MTVGDKNEKAQALLRQLAPTQEKLDQAVRLAVELTNPLQVIVFGSWARGEASWDSDLDLAVILPDEMEPQLPSLRKTLRHRLSELPVCIDLVLSSQTKAAVLARSVNSIFYDIFHDGQVLYEPNPAHAGASAAD